VPRDAAPTRRAIIEAALHLLRREGIDGFSVERVARLAGVAKGLVIYHFGSRAALLRRCGAALGAERARRLERGPGLQGIDAGWGALAAQQDDGTTRAWLSLASAGMMGPTTRSPELEAVAAAALLDGCAVALAHGVPADVVREAHDALWLALLGVLEADDEGTPADS
jgi:AcrR family transcriptional regulator